MGKEKDSLLIRVAVDREGILGRIARINALINQLRDEARELENMLLYCEERTADPVKESAGENN